jgi:hypothetical protein
MSLRGKGERVSTKIYGASDDLIEFDGEFSGEVGAYGTDDREKGALIIVSDGTILEVKYGKNDDAIWEIKLHKKGNLFNRIDLCVDSDEKPHSDVAHFFTGVTWAYAAKDDWEAVH